MLLCSGENVAISCCWFHCADALIKRLKKLGLADAYKDEDNIQCFSPLSVVLALAAGCHIESAFQEIKAMPATGSASEACILRQLLRYVERQ